MYKMSIGSSDKTEPGRREPELEFYLAETSTAIVLRVRDKANGVEGCGNILRISKETGKISFMHNVNKQYGLPLDNLGRVVTV